jgi:hypothetical protein
MGADRRPTRRRTGARENESRGHTTCGCAAEEIRQARDSGSIKCNASRDDYAGHNRDTSENNAKHSGGAHHDTAFVADIQRATSSHVYASPRKVAAANSASDNFTGVEPHTSGNCHTGDHEPADDRVSFSFRSSSGQRFSNT